MIIICARTRDISHKRTHKKAQNALAITRQVVDKVGENSVFMSINMNKFRGHELATKNILAKKAQVPVESEPLFGKTVDDIPAVLTQGKEISRSLFKLA